MGALFDKLGIDFSPRIQSTDSHPIPIHHKCRNCGVPCDLAIDSNVCAFAKFTRTGTKEQPEVIRTAVPDNRVRWSTSFDYKPIEFTAQKIKESKKEYVDRDPRDNDQVQIPWNKDDELCDRRSYHGNYKIVNRVPQNPCGRTGITGRGHLGHFGPNHAADPIVTRWKRTELNEKVLHQKTRKPILQFVCIKRRDTKELAIPGGMVDKKEKVTDTLQREFHEETLHFPDMDPREKHKLAATIKDIFENGGIRIYCGYVDDPRNTDNCWMETTAYNFHDENDEHLGRLNVNGGDDALKAFWHDLGSESKLYASHAEFLKNVATIHDAHW